MSSNDSSSLPISARVDRAAMRRQRSRAAPGYAAAAVLQNEVARRLLEHLDYVALVPRRVLDAGAADGATARTLQERYPEATVLAVETAHAMLAAERPAGGWWRRAIARLAQPVPLAVTADIDRLPLAAASVDMVWSNLALHWFDADAAFAEAHRVLRDEGLYAFTAFGPDTLRELRVAFGGVRDGFPHFADMHDVGDALVRAGFATPVVDMEVITLTYARVEDVLRDLRAAGGGNAMRDRTGGLIGRQRWDAVCRRYEQERRDGVLPASFEIVYGHAWKARPQRIEMPDGRRVIELASAPTHRR